MTLNISQFESRLPKTASENSRHSVRAAIMIANGFREKAEAIRGDGRLSAQGQHEKLSELKAATSTSGHLTQIRTLAQKQLDAVHSERNSFKVAVLKRTDDPLAEMRAAEIRTMLRGLPESERLRLATSDDADIRDAIALAPAVLSGVPRVVHEQIIDGMISSRFQTRSAELATIEDEAEAILAAATVAADFINRG